MRLRKAVSAIATVATVTIIVLAIFADKTPAATDAASDFRPPDTGQLEPPVADALQKAWVNFNAAITNGNPVKQGAAWGELGLIYQAHQMHEPAATCYENAISRDPGNIKWHYFLAITWQDTGDFDAAVQRFSIATELRPDYMAAKIRLAQAYSAMRDDANARKWFSRALDQESASAIALAGLGAIELRNSNYQSAIEFFLRALQAEPQASQLYYPLAQAYRGAGEKNAARNALEQRGDVLPALSDPMLADVAGRSQSTQFVLERGYAESRAGNYPAAIRLFQTALQNSPDDVFAWVSLGRAYELSGSTQRALANYQKALTVDPANIAANYRTGHLLAQLGRSEDALPMLRKAVDGDPQTTQWRLVLANALMRTGNYTEAMENYAEIDRLEPGTALVHYRYGIAMTAAGNCGPAREQLEAGFETENTSGEIIQALVRNISSCPPVTDEQKSWALKYAELLFDSRPNMPHLEALAMASAANRQFDRAVEYQTELVKRISAAGEDAEFARVNLDRYSRNEIAAGSWPENAAEYSPPVRRQSDFP